MPHLCKVYPGICLTTEGKAWKTLSQGSRRIRRYTYVYLTTFVRALKQLREPSQFSGCAIGCMTEGSVFDTTEKRKYYFHYRIPTGNFDPLIRLFSGLDVYILSPIMVNPLNAELNPICYFLALLAHHFLHVSMIRVKSLTLRVLMSYIYMYMTLVA